MNVNTEHQDVFLLLPWYANGSIAGAEKDRVEAHLLECSVCRREVSFVESIERATNSREGVCAIPRNGFAALMQRIDATEESRAAAPGWMDRVKEFFSLRMSAESGWALAAPALAVVLVAGYLAWPDGASREPSFQTLSSSESPQGEPLQLRVELMDGVVEADAKQTFRNIHADIVVSRTEDGSYALTLPQDSDPATVAKALVELRSNKDVVGAELMSRAE